jgi:hypothetical protein
MKLRPLALGLAIGVFWGVMMFLMTWVSYYTGYAELFLKAFTQIYPGYTVTPAGSALVLVYGFIDGFVFGAGIGWLYNRFSK